MFKIVSITTGLTIALLASAFSGAKATEITLGAVKDSYVDEAAPSLTAGDEEVLRVSADWNHPNDLRQKMILIQFDLDTLARIQMEVKKATLRLQLADEVPEPGKLEISRIAGGWDENTVRWLSKPLSSLDTVAVAMIPLSGVFEVDVTALVESWVNGTFENNGFYIQVPDKGLFVKAVFGSKDNKDASLRPSLVISSDTTDSMPNMNH
jgi:hypothetical protein